MSSGVSGLLDLMLQYENKHRKTAKGYGPFHITYDRWEAIDYPVKPRYLELSEQEASEHFIVNYWKQVCPGALEYMNIQELITKWYGTRIGGEEFWGRHIHEKEL